MNRVLAVRGQVAAGDGDAADAPRRAGRRDRRSTASRRSRSAPSIARAWITPTDVRASEDALAAIAEADLIVLGPGSLYTSLLPSLLLPEIRDAVATSPALRVFVCNVATQPGETTGFDLADHVEALVAHAGSGHRRRRSSATTSSGRACRRATAPRRSGCAGRRRRSPAPRLALEDVVDPGERPPPRSRPARRGAAEALRPRERQPAPLQRRPNGLNPARGAA